MATPGLPIQFWASTILQNDYQAALYCAQSINDGRVQAYQTDVDNWLVNKEKLGVILPIPKPALEYVVNEPESGAVTAQFGPNPVCGEDPRIAAALAPKPDAGVVRHVGPPYGKDPNRFFAFGDTSPVGDIYDDPVYGKVKRCVDHGQFMPINYWLKV